MQPYPIRVTREDPNTALDKKARLNYGRIHSFDWDVRVRIFGHVVNDRSGPHLDRLIRQLSNVWTAKGQTATPAEHHWSPGPVPAPPSVARQTVPMSPVQQAPEESSQAQSNFAPVLAWFGRLQQHAQTNGLTRPPTPTQDQLQLLSTATAQTTYLQRIQGIWQREQEQSAARTNDNEADDDEDEDETGEEEDAGESDD
jgi:hypothetical protein